MKVPSDELFRLIKSLSPQEKVFFKLFAARKTEQNNYILLFDAIDSLPVYDEGALRLKLKNAPFLKNLKQAKSYASEAILKCLQEYYSYESAEAKLSNSIQQIQILIDKRLFEWAKKMIAKAELLAEENYQYYYKSILLSLRREVMILESDPEEMNAYPGTHFREEIKSIEVLRNLAEYSRLNVQATTASQEQITASDSKSIELKKFLKDPLLQNESTALTLPAKLKYYNVLGSFYFLLKDWKKSSINYKKNVQLFEENPSYLKNEIEFYLIGINNLFASMIMLEDNKELTLLFNKVKRFMEALPRKQRSKRIYRRYISSNNNYISHLLQIHDFDGVIKLSEEIQQNIKLFYSTNTFIIFHFNLFLAYFFKQDLHKALHHVNEILNTEESGTLQDITDDIKLVNIIVHYELGNLELLPGLCRSTHHFFEKRNRSNKAEKLLVDFFGKVIHKANGRNERTHAFKRLQKELDLVQSNKIPGGFDFLAWAQSKTENRPFDEIVRKNKGSL